jgi:transcriptional regulator with XRE-family HTH domain
MPRRRKPNEDFHYVDVHVGKRLRRRREELAISRQRLGQAAYVVHQQVEKYEGAINRVSPGCLYRFARLLNVPITYFFEGLAHAARLSRATWRRR